MNERGSTGSAADAVSSGALGERVRKLRRGRGLTLEALAERSGVSRAMISKVERGEKNPTLVVAAKVAEGLGVSLSQLVGVEERREVILVPRDRRMVMRDPETSFERQLLSPASVAGASSSSATSSPKGPRPASFHRTAGGWRSTWWWRRVV